MSRSRQELLLISYSLAPSRNIRRVIDTSVYSIGRAPSLLSIVRVTSARPSGARPDVPAKMTSSIFPPRRALAPCSPRTQAMASTTLDLPEPFGPTTQVMPGSSRSVVAEAKDLKPFTVRLLRCTDLRGSAYAYLGCRLPAGHVTCGIRRAHVTYRGQKTDKKM